MTLSYSVNVFVLGVIPKQSISLSYSVRLFRIWESYEALYPSCTVLPCVAKCTPAFWALKSCYTWRVLLLTGSKLAMLFEVVQRFYNRASSQKSFQSAGRQTGPIKLIFGLENCPRTLEVGPFCPSPSGARIRSAAARCYLTTYQTSRFVPFLYVLRGGKHMRSHKISRARFKVLGDELRAVVAENKSTNPVWAGPGL